VQVVVLLSCLSMQVVFLDTWWVVIVTQ
jgi:hypothetical protein